MTAENFQACLAFTLKFEGGKSNDPRDPGGRTMEGVTQATYDAFRDHGRGMRQSVFSISAAERDEIYRSEYWNAVKGDVLRPGEDLCVFDFAVNSGPPRALDVWRRCGGPKVAIGGMIHSMCAHRLSFLHALRTWSYFGDGWGRRVAACEATALQMAGAPLQPALDRAKSKQNGHGTAGPIVTGVAVSGMAILHWLAHAAIWMILAFGIFGVFAASIMAFSHWRHGQRADALTAAIKDMKARASALKEAQAAEIAQKNAMRRQIEDQLQQIKLAEATEASMQSSLLQSNAPPGNAEAKK